MALDMIRIPADPKRDAKARELVSQVKTWHRGTLNEQWGAFEPGTTYRITPNGHNVNAVFCSCPDYRGGHLCKHLRAVVLWEAEQARLDAEIDAEIARVLGPAPLKRYEAPYPACKSGCGDISETRDGHCDRCASDRSGRPVAIWSPPDEEDRPRDCCRRSRCRYLAHTSTPTNRTR